MEEEQEQEGENHPLEEDEQLEEDNQLEENNPLEEDNQLDSSKIISRHSWRKINKFNPESKKISGKQFTILNRKGKKKTNQTNFHQEESTSNSEDKKKTRLNKINIFQQTGGPLPRLQPNWNQTDLEEHISTFSTSMVQKTASS